MSILEDALQQYQESPYHRYVEVGVRAALAAGELIRQAFSQPKRVSNKLGPTDLVTETDKACEQTILGIIRETFPNHAFIGEEESSASGATSALTGEPTWMVDPLDGTTNFVHSYPWVCISIALCIDRQARVAVVYNPILNEMFTAAQGHGAHLNGRRIAASGETQMTTALVGTEVGVSRDAETVDAIFDRVRRVTSQARSLRCGGSCALGLCGVAVGRLDSFYEIGFGGCWDCAAGALLVQEAGGVCIDPAGGPFDVMARRVLVASSPALAEAMAATIAGSKASAKEPQPAASVANGGGM